MSLGDDNSGFQGQVSECGHVDRDIVRCVGRLDRQPANWFYRPAGPPFAPCTSNNSPQHSLPFRIPPGGALWSMCPARGVLFTFAGLASARDESPAGQQRHPGLSRVRCT